MANEDGDRPEGNQPNPKPRPNSGPPHLRAVDDPAKLARLLRIADNALRRQGLTLADMEVPKDAREPVPI